MINPIHIDTDSDGINEEKQPSSTANDKDILSNLNPFEISKQFTKFKKDNRVLVIPIGFPQAGKSLLLSSLLHYAIMGKDLHFRTHPNGVAIGEGPFDYGRKVLDRMVNTFNSGKFFPANRMGSLDLIGVEIEPSKSKLPKLNLGFLDLAGEDIKSIKISERGAFTEKIDAVFKGIRIDKTPLIFVLITPFDPPGQDHDREDSLHFDFLNYLRETQSDLIPNSKFIIIVSQWDKNPDTKMSVESYIKEYRPMMYTYVKNTDVIWSEYSIGEVLSNTVNNVEISEIIRKNYDYPRRFWYKLYNICTGKSLNEKGFWEKLFG
jgi:hypothetical protein